MYSLQFPQEAKKNRKQGVSLSCGYLTGSPQKKVFVGLSGVPDRGRTYNPQRRRLILYPLSYGYTNSVSITKKLIFVKAL